MIRRIIWAALIAAFLALPHSAGAREGSPEGGWGAATLQAAQTYWGGATPTNCVTLDIQWNRKDMPEFGGVPSLGLATVASIPGLACTMTIGYIPDAYIRCLVVVHEYGHLLGLEHSDDPSNIMYPITSPAWDIAPCHALINKLDTVPVDVLGYRHKKTRHHIRKATRK